ncbi:hypothetical protein RB195_012521 [Necator americanus]|uniref:Uncharacterized protein n=1 Tax=Necator americanus TaxID=51031 RepID=A0ABR1D863_NECAM
MVSLVGSKRREARTVAQAAVLEPGGGIKAGPWRTADMGGGSEDPYTIPTATLYRSASSAAACTCVHEL